MAQSIVLSGALIRLYVNNKLYKEVQSITLNVDYGEQQIYGIDSPYPQEIAGNRINVSGSVTGVRIQNSGGIQAYSLRPTFTDNAASPYVSIRIQDRRSTEDIILIQQAKVTRESHNIVTKSSYKLNFEFIGSIPLWALDRS